MSAWPGKFVIGLTGNIATGKSIVRKYAEHLGAFGIDADKIAHRAIYQDAPGFHPVVQAFGKEILGSNNEIDRNHLAQIVFKDLDALIQLEAIVHPLVSKAINYLISHSKQDVVVIEAIKLIESGLIQKCDTLWVTSSPMKLQQVRIMKKRGISEKTAKQRIISQPSPETKFELADNIIQNDSSLQHLWDQVRENWRMIFSNKDRQDQGISISESGEITAQRWLPDQAESLSALLTRFSPDSEVYSERDLWEALTQKAFLVFCLKEAPIGVVGWGVENLVSINDDFVFKDNSTKPDILRYILLLVDSIAVDMQCEVSLMYPQDILKEWISVLTELGYERKTLADLNKAAWRETGKRSYAHNPQLYFKHLTDLPIFQEVVK